MTQEEYLKKFKETTDLLVSIVSKKNQDYSVPDDAFANFRLCDTMGICKTEEGIVVRMSDKFQRIVNLLHKENAVKDETINDSLLDLANYSLILYLYLQDQKLKEGGAWVTTEQCEKILPGFLEDKKKLLNDLEKTMAGFTGIRTVCGYCHKEFLTSSSCNKHINKKHKSK